VLLSTHQQTKTLVAVVKTAKQKNLTVVRRLHLLLANQRPQQ
jgi:hypothetical protein